MIVLLVPVLTFVSIPCAFGWLPFNPIVQYGRTHLLHASSSFSSASLAPRKLFLNNENNDKNVEIDYQKDYGRGVEHLTAELQEGDVVVYQTGTWYVDGVAVGDGGPAAWEYCLVDTIQIVWSHNCEHGVVRGFPLQMSSSLDEPVLIADFDNMIDFGPEQLVARIPVQKMVDQNECTFRPLVSSLSNELWQTTLD